MSKMRKKVISFLISGSLLLSSVPISAMESANIYSQGFTVDSVLVGEDARDILTDLKNNGNQQEFSLERQSSNGLTIEEQRIMQAFDTYINTVNRSQVGKNSSEADIQAFVEYAVANGIIEDTPINRTIVAIISARVHMGIVATAGGVLGFKMAEAFLNHSLQDNPSTYTVNRDTTYSNQVKNSTAHANLIASVGNMLNTYSGTIYTQTGSVALNSTTDLHLALNLASYILGAEKVGSSWNIYVRYYDVYDFAPGDWSKLSLSGAAIAALNQAGYSAMSIGAVVPYGIEIYTLNVK